MSLADDFDKIGGPMARKRPPLPAPDATGNIKPSGSPGATSAQADSLRREGVDNLRAASGVEHDIPDDPMPHAFLGAEYWAALGNQNIAKARELEARARVAARTKADLGLRPASKK